MLFRSDNDCCRSGYGFVVDARPDVHPETCIPITHVVQASLDDELTMARENCTHDHTLSGAINVNLIGAIMIHAWSRTSEEINLPGPYSCKKKVKRPVGKLKLSYGVSIFLAVLSKDEWRVHAEMDYFFEDMHQHLLGDGRLND